MDFHPSWTLLFSRAVGCWRYCHQPLCASFLHFLLPFWPVALWTKRSPCQRVSVHVCLCVCARICECLCLFSFDLQEKKHWFHSLFTSFAVQKVLSELVCAWMRAHIPVWMHRICRPLQDTDMLFDKSFQSSLIQSYGGLFAYKTTIGSCCHPSIIH